MFASRASWLTLFATVASSRRTSNSSATSRWRSGAIPVAPPSADSTISRGTDTPSCRRPGPQLLLLVLGQLDLLKHAPGDRLALAARPPERAAVRAGAHAPDLDPAGRPGPSLSLAVKAQRSDPPPGRDPPPAPEGGWRSC